MDALIYSYIDKKTLSEVMEAFYSFIGLNIELLDENGEVIDKRGERTSYCRRFISFEATKDICREVHAKTGRRAMELGEAYIFYCPSNLCHIVFPLVSGESLLGSVMVGPFIMEELDSTLVLDVGKRFSCLKQETLMNMYDDAHEIPRLLPEKVTHLSHLIYHLFSGVTTGAKERFIINRQKAQQQSMISETIRMFKTAETTEEAAYPFAEEGRLVAKVKEGNIEEARSALNDILGKLLLTGRNDLSLMRNRSMELCTILSRTAAGAGVSQKQIMEINDHFMSGFHKYNTVEDLCYALEEVLYAYMECMFPITPSHGSAHVRRAMIYVSRHFSENITLADAAAEAFLNENYFSRLFHKTTGMTFKEYLLMVRMEEAKRLLKNTDYSLMEIAVAVGYNNQSYFARVFRSYAGMTPSEYRRA